MSTQGTLGSLLNDTEEGKLSGPSSALSITGWTI